MIIGSVAYLNLPDFGAIVYSVVSAAKLQCASVLQRGNAKVIRCQIKPGVTNTITVDLCSASLSVRVRVRVRVKAVFD